MYIKELCFTVLLFYVWLNIAIFAEFEGSKDFNWSWF